MKKPNIVYVFPDEFNPYAMGFMNEYPVITPNLDKFSSESVVLENAISNQPVCSPYRAMLMTSKYGFATGVTTNCNSNTTQMGVYLKEDEICMTDVLSKNSYNVGYIGKWHLDPVEPKHAQYTEGYRPDGVLWDAYPEKHRRHGIDYWYGYGCNDNHFHPNYWGNDSKVDESIRPDEWSAKHETDIAIKYILNTENQRDENKPFALFLAYNPPHMPFDQVPEQYRELYKGIDPKDLLTRKNIDHDGRISDEKYGGKSGKETAYENVANYFAAISGIDEQFGKVLAALEEKGLTQDTIVVFTSDHGDMMGSQNLMHKSTWYSESFKVPFLIRYPKALQPSTRDFVMSVTDVMPTLLSMAGLSTEIPKNIHGENKTDLLMGYDRDTEGLYFNYGINARGLKTPSHTFVSIKDRDNSEQLLLFDDVTDPYQLSNIADSSREITSKLRDKTEWLLKQAGDNYR